LDFGFRIPDPLRLRLCILASSFWLLTSLVILSCKDPYGYEPFDPTKPDPPAAPILQEPTNGKQLDNYAYPQNVTLKWKSVAGTRYYQIEVYSDSVLTPENLQQPLISDIYSTQRAVTFYDHGDYYWRVRAYSPNWNWYTGWSQVWQFWLPDPAAR